MRRLIYWLVLASIAWGEPVRIILDTDIGPDSDDAGALAVLHALANRGEAVILGMMCSTTSEWGAPALDAINTWYNRPDIPVGTLKGPGNPGHGPQWKGDTYNRYLATERDNDLRSGRRAPDAVALYRELLAAERDRSVVVVSIGNTTNLRDLLAGAPQLVRAKVKLLSLMGGRYPRGRESNLNGDLRASQELLESWPTPIMFSGFEIGDAIQTGPLLSERTPAENPVRIAYARWDDHFWRAWDREYRGEPIRPHPSYDQTAVLYAVRGLQDYWIARTNGCNHLFDDGTNEWRPSPNRRHSYLVPRMPPEQLARIIESLMIAEPAPVLRFRACAEHLGPELQPCWQRCALNPDCSSAGLPALLPAGGA